MDVNSNREVRFLLLNPGAFSLIIHEFPVWFLFLTSLNWNLKFMIDHDQSPKITMLNGTFFMIFVDLTL